MMTKVVTNQKTNLKMMNKIEAENAFKEVISQKIGDALDLKRVEVSNTLVKHHIPQDADASEEV